MSRVFPMNVSFSESTLVINGSEYAFDGLHFMEQLPSGSNAIVLKARQTLLDRVVIVKIWYKLRPNDNRDKSEQGIKEAKKLAQLNHINICKIHDASTIKGLPYAILEYIEGQTLESFLETNPSFDKRVKIWRKIVDAISYSYGMSIFHGDLHSKNIIVQNNEDIKIIDFGTSYFSGRHFSLKREIKKLQELVQLLFPEYKLSDFLDIDLQVVTNFHALRALESWVTVIFAFYLYEEHWKPDPIADIWMSFAQAPIFKFKILLRIFKRYSSEKRYGSGMNFSLLLGIFYSHIEHARNPNIHCSQGKVLPIRQLEKLYLDWRTEYLQLDIQTIEWF